jgi:catechol 2,3-dioxygenase-like lactoylglutathione lyase family enzyme
LTLGCSQLKLESNYGHVRLGLSAESENQMSLHRLTSVTAGVPNLDASREFYRDFGLAEGESGHFSSRFGGEQLVLVERPQRGVLEIGIGCHDEDDIGRTAAALAKAGLESAAVESVVRAREPVTGLAVRVEVADEIKQEVSAAHVENSHGARPRLNRRAPGIIDPEPARPRKLGHVVIGTPDRAATQDFFLRVLGFRLTDQRGDHMAFMRCSTDHHNVAVSQAPRHFLHHTSWEVDDIDQVGQGAGNLLAVDPARHLWGLGRHFYGSNYFWYFRDPAGHYAEYYSDMDEVTDGEVWSIQTAGQRGGAKAWGPPMPKYFGSPWELDKIAPLPGMVSL